MQKKMPFRERITAILPPLIFPAIYGYFRTLQYGHMGGYITGLILAPASAAVPVQGEATEGLQRETEPAVATGP